ncbi:MAG TPA: APC family permease [Candidatus Dormibacteraeota bacterium]|nr:APC family permease [Candidatus Dormibacteraeota bacterium]
MDSHPRIFLRQTTGLTKRVSLLDAIAINVSYMSVGAALALVGFTMLALPTVDGVNLVYGSAIAALLAVPQMVVYTMLSRRVSRTGGDYVWLSRSLGGFLGSTITFTGITLETMPYLALIALSAVFAIGSVGLSLGFSGMLGLALPGNVAGADQFYQFLLASAMVIVLVAINIARPRLGFRLISVFWILGLIGISIATMTILIAGRAGVENYINHLEIPNTSFSSIQASYSGPTFNLDATLMMMPYFALFTYPWFQAAPSVGSELSGKASRLNVPISLLVAFVAVTIPFASMYYVGGYRFMTAALSNPTLVNNYSFNFWSLAMGVSSNIVQAFLIGLGWVLLTIAILAFGVITVSRYMLAQAFDRFLPARLAYVSPKYGSPVVAHILDLAVTVVLIDLAAFLYGTISSLYGSAVSSMIYFAFVGIAAVVYAIRNERKHSKFILAVAGLLQTVVFLYLTYQFLAYPRIWGGNVLAYGYVAAAFLLGTIIYMISKSKRAKEGLSFDLAFKEIPPE